MNKSDIFLEQIPENDLITLARVPATQLQISNLVCINNNEIAVATATQRNQNGQAGIWVYNITTNQWRLHVKYPKYLHPCGHHSICYNPSTNILWLFGDDRKMVNINMLKKSVAVIKSYPRYVGNTPQLLFIDNKLHVIGGSDSKHHLVWNDEKKEFDKEIFTFPDMKNGYYGGGLVHAKKENILYLFGGYDYGLSGQYSSIWKCEINKGYKWTKLELTIKWFFYYDAYVMSPNEKYIVMFGNKTRLFDVEEEKLYEVKGMYNGAKFAVINGNVKDELIVNGYIRNVVKEVDVLIPLELIAVIDSYYRSEIIYSISNADDDFTKLSLDVVLNADRFEEE